MTHRYEVLGTKEHNRTSNYTDVGHAGIDGFSRFEQLNLRNQRVMPGSIVRLRYPDTDSDIEVCFVNQKSGVANGYAEVHTSDALFRLLHNQSASPLEEYVLDNGVRVVICSVNNEFIAGSGDFE